MELNRNEFNAMQGGFKEFIHEKLDLKALESLGLTIQGKNILEVGCGSGFGAELLLKFKPSSYLGIDIMEDQIDLARSRNLVDANFELMDATKISSLGQHSIDEIVDFRILHHIPEWKSVIEECFEVLSPGGAMYVIEPYRVLSRLADTFLEWQHPEEALFTVAEFENQMKKIGFITRSKTIGYGFAMQGKKPV